MRLTCAPASRELIEQMSRVTRDILPRVNALLGPSPLKHVLFICSQNRLRSPTAEKIFFGRPGIEVASAGLNPDAVNTLSSDLLEWADVVFVMEKSHRNKLSKKFKTFLTNQRVICLDIPDLFEYMDPMLVQLLEEKVGPFLARYGGEPS